jgi:hypothetical protein
MALAGENAGSTSGFRNVLSSVKKALLLLQTQIMVNCASYFCILDDFLATCFGISGSAMLILLTNKKFLYKSTLYFFPSSCGYVNKRIEERESLLTFIFTLFIFLLVAD